MKCTTGKFTGFLLVDIEFGTWGHSIFYPHLPEGGAFPGGKVGLTDSALFLEGYGWGGGGETQTDGL